MNIPKRKAQSFYPLPLCCLCVYNSQSPSHIPLCYLSVVPILGRFSFRRSVIPCACFVYSMSLSKRSCACMSMIVFAIVCCLHILFRCCEGPLPAGKPKRRFYIHVFALSESRLLRCKKPRGHAVFCPNIFLVFLGWLGWRDSNPRDDGVKVRCLTAWRQPNMQSS